MGKLQNLGRNDNTVPPGKNIIHFSLTFASEKKILLKNTHEMGFGLIFRLARKEKGYRDALELCLLVDILIDVLIYRVILNI